MSLYNLINGFNISCVLVLPMLGKKADEYPRFRDCFVSPDEKHILVYLRVGGHNRNQGYGEESLYKMPTFIRTYDDEEDSTYGMYEFDVPERWKDDFCHISQGDLDKVSDEYVEFVKQFYPILSKDGVIDSLFQRGDDSDGQAENK